MGQPMRSLVLTVFLMAGVMIVASAELPLIAGESAAAATPEPTANQDLAFWSGELPLILSVPHGGELSPASMPDRVNAVVNNDPGSVGLGVELATEIERRTGRRPHLVANRLHRRKMDPNRGLAHGAQGGSRAEEAWRDYHAALDETSRSALDRCGRGVLVDLHSHGKENQRIEIGFGLSSEELAESDDDLAKRRFVYNSSIRSLALSAEIDLAQLVRGESSLGGNLARAGYRVVPSPDRPVPSEPYFDGGYITYVHGSRRGGGVDAVQIELPYELLRGPRRAATVAALAEALLAFLTEHYDLNLEPGASPLCSPYLDVSVQHPSFAAIELSHGYGLIEPCSAAPRRFCPDRPATRGGAALAIWRALQPGTAPPASGHWPLVDLSAGEAADAATALWRGGYLDLCGILPPRFCPQDRLERGTLAAWALRLDQGRTYIPPRPQGRYPDAPVGEWATWWLEPAVDRELIPACAQGQGELLCPQGTVSRADLAATLAAALDLEPEKPRK